MMSSRVICVMIIMAALCLTSAVYGGPARSLATVVGARAVKIPRSIRTPFRNDQIMTARGFGKRSQQMIRYKDDDVLRLESELPWDTNRYENRNIVDNQEFDLANGPLMDAFAIEWIMDELTTNPVLLRSLLERIVDRKHDDHTVARTPFEKPTNEPKPLF